MQFRQPRKDDARIEITPLVDVVFLLLIFFMLASTFIVTPGIKVNLPKAEAEKVTREKKEVRVVITKDNRVFLERRLVTLQELEQRLKGVAQKNPQTLIIIQADAKALHGKVVEVMGAAKTSGLNRLAIATQPKEKKGGRR
ncbi:MAG: biopolymer transporter ExbD [Deltaproteobacteria bacterium]|nr:biopolymer transporter ExbD [Deltaproteobacteria bacterium]